jgi:signal transduction histidine kinase
MPHGGFMKLSLQLRYSLAVVCILTAVVLFMGIAHLHGFQSLIKASTYATNETISDGLYAQEQKQGVDLAGLMANLLSRPLASNDSEGAKRLAAAAAEMQGSVYVAVSDPDGRIRFTARSASAGAVTADHPSSVEPQTSQIRAAIASGKTMSRSDGSFLYVSAPISENDRLLGAVNIGISLRGTQAELANIGGYMDAVAETSIRFFIILYVGIALMIVVIGFGIGIVMVRDMARPIRALGRYMRRIGTGSYDEPRPFERADELGDLAREAEQMAQNLKKVAQVSRLATLGEMSVGVAHELNQPLNTIRMAAENVLLSRRSNPDDAEFVEGKLRLISDQAANMGELIQRMCVVGRAGGDRVLIDARESVRDAVSLLSNKCEDDDIDLIVDFPETEASVLGQRNELAQVVINLLGNARDAILECRTAGQLSGPAAGGRIEVRVSLTFDRVVIEVADDGGGIAPGVSDRVFDPFFTTKEVTKGTGLGLSISFGIVNSMGGRLWARNGEAGAVFTVDLPRVRADGAGAPQSGPGAQGH